MDGRALTRTQYGFWTASGKTNLTGPHNFTLTALGGKSVALRVPSLTGQQLSGVQF